MTDEDISARPDVPGVVRRLRLGSPAARAAVLGLPLVAMTSVLAGSSHEAHWVVPSSANAGNQAWLNELVGPVPTTSPGETPAPDVPVIPSGGDPQVLVLPGPGVGSGGRGASAPAASDTGALTSSGIPVRILRGYVGAANQAARIAPSCHISWSLLAGIGRVETDHGRFGGAHVQADGVVTPPIYGPRLNGTGGMPFIHDTDGGRLDGDAGSDRAVGPMQFIPGTWAGFGTDADGDRVANPQDIDDAALSAARYLCAGGGDLGTQQGRFQAVYRYNHSTSYVQLVLALADSYASGRTVPIANEPPAPVTPPDGPSATGGSPPVVNPSPLPPPGSGGSPAPTTPKPTTSSPSTPPGTTPTPIPPTPTVPTPRPTTPTPSPTSPAPSPTSPTPAPTTPTPAPTTPTPAPTTPTPTPTTTPPAPPPPAPTPTPTPTPPATTAAPTPAASATSPAASPTG